MNQLYQATVTALRNVIHEVAGFLPNLVSALLILLIGWLVAKVAQKIISQVLRTLHTDQAAERVGIVGLLRKLGIEQSPVALISRTLFWIIIFVALLATSEVLRLTYVAQLFSQFVTYIPNIIGAALIFVIGLAVARFLESSVRAGAKNAGIEYAAAIGVLVKYFLALIVIILALAQLGVRTDILTNIFTVLVISLGLALALALGLGSRAVVGNILAGAFAREHFAEGRIIQVQGMIGKIVEVGSVGTTIEKNGQQITIPNVLLVENVVEQPLIEPEGDRSDRF